MSRTSFRFGDLRVVVLGLVFVLAWAGIGYRLFQVQGADAAELAQRGFDQRVRHETIPAKRGTNLCVSHLPCGLPWLNTCGLWTWFFWLVVDALC